MRRYMLLAVAVALAAPAVVGQEFNNFGLPDENVARGSLVLAQVIQFTVPAGDTVTIEKINVTNTAANPVVGTEVEYIEVRRNNETGPVLKKQTTGLDNFTTEDGVVVDTVTTASIREFTAGTHRLYVFVKLKADVTLDRKIALGDTVITAVIPPATEAEPIDVTYAAPAAPAAVFTVRVPTVEFIAESVPDGNVYRGQRFLAGRIEVDGDDLPFESTITQFVFTNTPSGATTLAGNYLAGIEVRRASDDALLGQTTTATELAKFTTTGTTITTSSNNKVPPYSTLILEIWITLKPDAPTGHNLQLLAVARIAGWDQDAGDAAPAFVVGEPMGFEEVNNLAVAGTGGQVFSGQRFLAQRIEVVDFDDDPYDVKINSLVIQNVAATDRLSDNQIDRIEVIRARDGAAMGQVTSASGLNSGGVRISTGSNNTVLDDTTEILEIWVTLKANIPHGRAIQLQTTIWHTEDTKTFGKQHDATDSAEFVTGPAVGQGFETAAPVAIADRPVFQGVRFLAQKLNLPDNDPDPYDVIIASLMVRNAVTDSPLADQNVAKVEVRRASDGALLGEVTDPVGLSLGGVRITTPANNLVLDDGTVELEIWVTLKDPIPVGRKLQLETVVWHTEGAATHQTDVLLGPATFTTAIGQPPTGVDFTWTPAAPEAGAKVTFTPATGIADPSGDITKATFHWNFGDGQTAQTTGAAAVDHTYDRGGTFQVMLTVTGQGDLASSKTHAVEVIGQQPVVDFTATPSEPAAGQAVTFTSQVTDPATPPLTPYTYAWAFGDGGTSTAANPQHTYTEARTYTVVLSVTNSRGETGRKEKTITVAASSVNRRPVVTAIAVSPVAPVVDQTITFTATANDADDDAITGYEWKLGDETVATTTVNSTTHTFTTADVFRIQVRARDAGGFGEWFSLDVYVRPQGGAAVGTKALDNPARTQCRIQVFLPLGATDVSIQIFDMLGREVRRSEVAGTQFTWDLKDGNGRSIADGLYFYLITATVGEKTERSEIGKILVVR